MPARADIDPAEMAPILPHVVLLDVLDGGARFRYRLVGTAVASLHRTPSTGRFVDEIIPERIRDGELSSYRDAVRQRRPLHTETAYLMGDGNDIWHERIVLPLSNHGMDVNIVLCGDSLRYNSPFKPPGLAEFVARSTDIRFEMRFLE